MLKRAKFYPNGVKIAITPDKLQELPSGLGVSPPGPP